MSQRFFRIFSSGSARTDEAIVIETTAQRIYANFSCRRGSVDELSAAEINAGMIYRIAAGTAGVETNDIAALQRRNRGDLGHGAVAALGSRSILGADAGFAHAIVHKPGAVKTLGRIGVGRIGFSDHILGDVNRIFNALAFAHAGTVRRNRGFQRGGNAARSCACRAA